jgi:hypothetical protein
MALLRRTQTVRDAEVERWKVEQRLADRRAGTIAAMLANVNRRKGGKPVGWEDIFPDPEKRAPKRAMTDDEMFRQVRVLNKQFGGIEVGLH